VKTLKHSVIYSAYVGIYCHQSVLLINLALVLYYDDNNDEIKFCF